MLPYESSFSQARELLQRLKPSLRRVYWQLEVLDRPGSVPSWLSTKVATMNTKSVAWSGSLWRRYGLICPTRRGSSRKF